MADGEKIIPINIEEEMKSKYIDYSMSVIVSRALPDVRDGLKPVHRRVLYGMHELGVTSTKSIKSQLELLVKFLVNFIRMVILLYMTLWSGWLKNGHYAICW